MYSADQIADELVVGLNSTWESPEQGEPLPFEELTTGGVPIGDAIATRAFTEFIAWAIAEDRTSATELDPIVTHDDRLQALRVAEDVRTVLIERGHRDAETTNVAWRDPEREALLKLRPLEDEAALPEIERNAAERSLNVGTGAVESADERKTVLERMRGWREARREASGRAGVDDVDHRRDAWQTAHGREMRTADAGQRGPQQDAAHPAVDRGIER